SVTISTNDAGDLVVRVTTCPDSAASARATALFPTQALDYRLECLRALAQRWPDEIPDVCAQILARDQEEALVLAWCVGHLQAGGTPVERPWELVGRISGGGFREAKVAEAILSATDGCEFAGALAMVEPNTTGMRSLLIAGISACEDWQQGEARGMNAGIALRRLHAAGAADALIQAVIGHQGRQASEDAMVALGALGDDSAVDFLKAQALDRNAHTRDINCVAAQALALMGTPTALQASLDIWRTSEDREVQARAFRGLKVACGQDEAIWHTYGVVLPAWEPARMAPQEGRRLCRELLAQVDAASLDERRVSDLTSLLRYLDQQEGRAGG
ncbi:MAG: HEAT repeat domain-containing protein, partial [Armatimonadota bacterium]